MKDATSPPLSLDLGIAIGGPAALGLTLGLAGVAADPISPALIVPAAVLGTTLLMLPALYIGSALSGAGTTARQMARGAIGALREAGVASLGLVPALLFLATTSSADTGAFAVAAALAGAALLGVRGLYRRLFGELELGAAKAKAVLVYSAWATVAFGIGARLAVPAFG